MADGCHGSGEGAVLGRKADGNHEESQFHGAVKLQQGQVAVGAGLVVAGVDHHFENLLLLLSLLVPISVVFTFTGTELLFFTFYINFIFFVFFHTEPSR